MQQLHQPFKQLRSAYDSLATNRVEELSAAHAALVRQLQDPATSGLIDQRIAAAIRGFFGSCDTALRTLREDKKRDSFRREERIGREFDYKAPPVRKLIDLSIRHLQSARDKRLDVARITCTTDLVRLLEAAYAEAVEVYGSPGQPSKTRRPRKPKRRVRRHCQHTADHALAVCMLVIGNAPHQGLFPYSYSVTVGLMAKT
jgi:hypothetical protein